MIKRYPHTAKIVIVNEVDNNTSTPDIVETAIDIIGRYEPKLGNKTLDYKSKFYTHLNSISDFEVDGQKFIYKDKEFTIVQLHNYQKHCEIWLD